MMWRIFSSENISNCLLERINKSRDKFILIGNTDNRGDQEQDPLENVEIDINFHIDEKFMIRIISPYVVSWIVSNSAKTEMWLSK